MLQKISVLLVEGCRSLGLTVNGLPPQVPDGLLLLYFSYSSIRRRGFHSARVCGFLLYL